MCGPAWAASSGAIVGVTADPEATGVRIDCEGDVGKHLARVIGQPNRLVVDFSGGSRVGKVPRRIKVGRGALNEIRVGRYKGRARVVLDFQDNPVPAFKIRRDDDHVSIRFGKSLSSTETGSEKKAGQSHLSPRVAPASAKPVSAGYRAKRRDSAQGGKEQSRRSSAPPKAPVFGGAKLAQRLQVNGPASSVLRDDKPKRTASRLPSSTSQGGGSGRMVREVRPPVTPPTPDPRLVVQEVTELKFIQVGHNSRLIVRGGDHLDYRLNKESPTKVRVDLINAEIPKAHRKPLRTDQWSTSVEMIIPGSQTIFVQLKDAVPYQVEKKKGVLMIDFPPPRFALTEDQKTALTAQPKGDQVGREAAESRREALLAKREAGRIMREEQIRQANETREKQIRGLLKEQEDILKERRAIERKYRITGEPEIFSKPVTMDFQGISLRNAFRLLGEQAGINIILGPGVQGTTTLRLHQVPLGQVLDHVLRTHGLDKEIVGNVMRIDTAGAIAASKAARMQEYQRLLSQIQGKLERNRTNIRQLEQEREKALKELAQEQEAVEEAPEEITQFETVGATETIEIEGEPVTLLLVKVKLNYAEVAEITPILNCVFNRRCEGVGPTPAQTDQSSLGAYSAELAQQGFQPGSPGYQSRMNTFLRRQEAGRRTRAAEALVQQQPVSEAVAGLRGEVDPRMAKILAHTVLWANDTYNMLFIKDLPERIEEMKKLISSLDVPTPQVLIESRLVQASQNWARGVGIQWGGAQNQTGPISINRNAMWGLAGNSPGVAARAPTQNNTTTINPPLSGTQIPSQFLVNLPASVFQGVVNGMAMQFGFVAGQYATDLDLRLSLGESQGKTKVIARPKVQVMDGESATIVNGQQIAFQTFSADGTQTQLVNVDLRLSVTPTIYPDGRIQMEISVSDNDVGDDVNGVASILTREAQTVMIVKDGSTAVIGGILRQTDNSSRQGWPGLMNVPVINYLFSNKSSRKDVEELLVFITPTIVKLPPSAS